jgi:uncharacterized protein YdeI (YjbR/CyaY-like superfamily)
MSPAAKSPSEPQPDDNRVQVDSRAAWSRWLATRHHRTQGVWLVTFKKAAGAAHLPYDEAVEEGLAWSWVDSKPRALDATRTMLWFAPRKPRTGWSRPNQERVARLIDTGRMQPAGLAKVEAAKADGSWHKLDRVEDGVVPDDLAQALDGLSPARQHFEAFPRSVRRGILEWIEQAKRPETRARRVSETAALAQRNERANQWKAADQPGRQG